MHECMEPLKLTDPVIALGLLDALQRYIGRYPGRPALELNFFAFAAVDRRAIAVVDKWIKHIALPAPAPPLPLSASSSASSLNQWSWLNDDGEWTW